jgi:hypothetical protein
MKIEKILDEIYIINEEENSVPLTKRQVCNILNTMLFYPIADEDQFRTALYYSVKLRSLILLCSNHITTPYRQEYNHYTNLRYPIEKVLQSMGIINYDEDYTPSYEDFITKEIKDATDEIICEIKESMNVKMRVRTNGDQSY